MKDAEPLLLFPFNGNAREALDCLGARWRCIGFIDDVKYNGEMQVNGIEIYDRSALIRWPNVKVLAVPGGPMSYQVRKQTINGLAIQESRFAKVVHPSAQVSDLVEIGRNTLIMAGAVVTSNAIVGRHCCILPNTVIHHDAHIGDWTLIGANVTICGGTQIGENCYIGAASSVMNDLTIGDGAMIGFGSNVIRDVVSGSCVAGNPARQLYNGKY